jgi:hypothetical protein
MIVLALILLAEGRRERRIAVIAKLEELGAQMLAKVVPSTTASAAAVICWWESCGGSCVGRRCCEVPQYGKTCGGCTYLC